MKYKLTAIALMILSFSAVAAEFENQDDEMELLTEETRQVSSAREAERLIEERVPALKAEHQGKEISYQAFEVGDSDKLTVQFFKQK